MIYFYPKDNTPGCTAEACAFRDQYEDFVQAGARVVGISRDDPASHRGFADKHRLPFTLLADPDGAYTRPSAWVVRWGCSQAGSPSWSMLGALCAIASAPSCVPRVMWPRPWRSCARSALQIVFLDLVLQRAQRDAQALGRAATVAVFGPQGLFDGATL